MAHIHFINVIIANKIRVVFVHCVVGQMHADVVQVVSVRRNVLLSSESRQPLSVNINPHRIATG